MKATPSRYSLVTPKQVVTFVIVIIGILGIAFLSSSSRPTYTAGPSSIASKNIFFSQATVGNGNGENCDNAMRVSYLNNSVNWGTGETQIGPGTTAHLCGKFNVPTGGTLLTTRGSGTAGSPITIRFEDGAVVQSPAFGGSGGIVCNGNDYITIDGGVNGIIQNTANGTSLANHLPSVGVKFENCSNAVIQNLHILTLYVHTQEVNDPNDPDASMTAGINVSQGDNVMITRNTLTDVNIAIGIGSSGSPMKNAEVSFNNLTNCNRCLVAAAVGVVTGMKIHDNDFGGGAQLWDAPNNGYHHNPMHLFTNSGPGDHMNNVLIYNNYVHGQWGGKSGHVTSGLVFLDYLRAQTPVYIFNNIYAAYDNVNSLPSNGVIACNAGNVCEIFNNLIVGVNNGKFWGTGVGCGADGTAHIVSKNNIFAFTGAYYPTCVVDEADHNTYFNVGVNGQYIKERIYADFKAWQNASFDSHSSTVDPKLDANYKVRLGSPAIGGGTNLSGLGISELLFDKATRPRPISGPWTIGPYVAP